MPPDRTDWNHAAVILPEPTLDQIITNLRAEPADQGTADEASWETRTER